MKWENGAKLYVPNDANREAFNRRLAGEDGTRSMNDIRVSVVARHSQIELHRVGEENSMRWALDGDGCTIWRLIGNTSARSYKKWFTADDLRQAP